MRPDFNTSLLQVLDQTFGQLARFRFGSAFSPVACNMQHVGLFGPELVRGGFYQFWKCWESQLGTIFSEIGNISGSNISGRCNPWLGPGWV